MITKTTVMLAPSLKAKTHQHSSSSEMHVVMGGKTTIVFETNSIVCHVELQTNVTHFHCQQVWCQFWQSQSILPSFTPSFMKQNDCKTSVFVVSFHRAWMTKCDASEKFRIINTTLSAWNRSLQELL